MKYQLPGFFISYRCRFCLSLLCFILGIGLFYQKIKIAHRITERPAGEHLWAQTDRASMALTYYMDDASFWLPRCHRATANPEGITAGEFPLIPYTVSLLYKTGGFHEVYYRLTTLCLSLAGFIFSWLLALRFIRQPLWAVVPALLWVSSPNIIYYSTGFLPDIPALSFLIIAVYILFSGTPNLRLRHFIGFGLFLSLAILLKISVLCIALPVLLAAILSPSVLPITLRKQKIMLGIAIIIPVLLAAGWVYYARQLVAEYGISTFLLQPEPPQTWQEIRDGIHAISYSLDKYYMPEFRYILPILTLIALPFIRRGNRFLLLATVFIYLAFMAMFLLMFRKSPFHEYYWLPFQFGVFFHLCWLTDLWVRSRIPVWVHIISWIGCLVLINYNAVLAARNINGRWEKHKDRISVYYDLENTLERQRISYDKRIFSFADPSYNITLYLMNRKGVAFYDNFVTDEVVEALRSCDYAVLSDTSVTEYPELKPYFYQRIDTHHNLVIYQLDAH